MKRSLYDCQHAKVRTDRVSCENGYLLSERSKDSSISILRVVRGESLELAVCQQCPDFSSMGKLVPLKERGWLRKRILEE